MNKLTSREERLVDHLTKVIAQVEKDDSGDSNNLDMLTVLKNLTEFVTSGRRYESKNPYMIPEVEDAMFFVDRPYWDEMQGLTKNRKRNFPDDL